uniref:Auxilin-related protein 2 n=2 Tax=Lygus hesperus TaxID=30085 RepID=A0A0A9X1P5_LYGHE
MFAVASTPVQCTYAAPCLLPRWIATQMCSRYTRAQHTDHSESVPIEIPSSREKDAGDAVGRKPYGDTFTSPPSSLSASTLSSGSSGIDTHSDSRWRNLGTNSFTKSESYNTSTSTSGAVFDDPTVPVTPSWDESNMSSQHIQSSVMEEKALVEQAYPIVEPKITAWQYCNGQEKTIAALLATLPSVLWENNSWKPVDLSTLNDLARIKKAYKRSLLTIHPDKVVQAPIIVKATAERIFQVLSTAFHNYEQNQNSGRVLGRAAHVKR